MNYKFRVWRTLFKCDIGLIFVSVGGLVTAVKCCWHLCVFGGFFCLNPLRGMSDGTSSAQTWIWISHLCLQCEPALLQIMKVEQEKKKKKNGLNLLSTMTALSAVCCYTDFVMYKQYGTTSRREHVFRLILEVALKQSLTGFDLLFGKDCQSESLSKAALTWCCEEMTDFVPLHPFPMSQQQKKKINILTICQIRFGSTRILLWFVCDKEMFSSSDQKSCSFVPSSGFMSSDRVVKQHMWPH